MQILVNHEPLSYSLESEESLGEIVDGLATWLRDGEYAITGIQVDDRSLPIHDRTGWQDVDPEQVDTLHIEALPLTQVEHTTVSALADYCALLQRALREEHADALGELAAELPYVRTRLGELFPGVIRERGDGVLVDPELEKGNLPAPEAASRLEREIAALIATLESRMREYSSPDSELMLTLGQLVACATALEEVPVQLQTGDEGSAMGAVILFTEYLSRIIRLLPMVSSPDVPVAEIRSFAKDITPYLQELQGAFEVHDSVLIGDLLEYELAPRLAGLRAAAVDGPVTPESRET
jgi:hypothetical protein